MQSTVFKAATAPLTICATADGSEEVSADERRLVTAPANKFISGKGFTVIAADDVAVAP